MRHKILRTKYNVELLNVTHNSKKLIDSLIRINPDVAFNCLHGFFGEDGQISLFWIFLKFHTLIQDDFFSINE